MQLYSIRNKASKKLLGVKMTVTEAGNIFYTFTEDTPTFVYVHLSRAFVTRAISPNEYYDGSWLHPFWGLLAPEYYELVAFQEES